MSAARMRATASGMMLCCLAAGCSSHPGPSGIDPLVQAQLRHDLAVLSQAAAAHHTAAARSALATLTADAGAAHTAGTLSDSKLQQLQAAAHAVRVDLTVTPPRTTAVPQPPPAPEPTSSANNHGNGHGHGDGGGNSGGNGGD